jgi:hypothetical protein
MNLFERYGLKEESSEETIPTESPIAQVPVQQEVPTRPSVVSDTTSPLFSKYGITEESNISTKKPTITQQDVLADPARMQAIRNMMVASKDVYYETAPDEEVYDDFMTHMRWFNTNELSTASTALAVANADDETKEKYANAFRVYDEIGGLYSGGGNSVMEKISGTTDYVAAAIFAPSTLLGGIVGKFAGRGATVAAQKAVIEAVGTEVVRRTGSAAAGQTVRRQVVNAGIRGKASVEFAGALAVEAPAAGLQDHLYQNTMLEVGVQEERDIVQTALSTLLGGVGASIIPATNLGRATNITGLNNTAGAISEGRAIRRGKSSDLVIQEVRESVRAVNSDWMKLVQEGRDINADVKVRGAVVDWFTNVDDPNSFFRMLLKSGAELDLEGEGLAKSMTDFAEGLSDAQRKSLDEAFEPMGVTFHQVSRIFANWAAEDFGGRGNQLSRASKLYREFQNISVANRISSEEILKTTQDAQIDKNVKGTRGLAYVQSVWKRFLISHPGTSILNVAGWGINMTARTMAEMMQSVSMYGIGAVQKLYDGEASKVTLGAARASANNMLFAAKTLMDPWTSVDSFFAYAEAAPKKYREALEQQFFQGVSNRGAAAYGLNPDSLAIRGTERMMEFAQNISFVTMQDTVTKSMSGLKELDKQARLRLGMGLAELNQRRMTHLLDDEAWDHTIRALQEDTFSKSWVGEKGYMAELARISQQVSEIPGLGVIYPFGQFVNSVFSFTWRHSPLGMINVASAIAKKKGVDYDIGLAASRSIVGTAALAWATSREAQKEQDGLQWYEERNDRGDVYRVDNLFPIGLYNLGGRIAHRMMQGDGMERDLVARDLARQLSVPAALQDVAGISAVSEIINYITDGETSDDDRNGFFDILGMAMEGVPGVLSGFTRPLDPLNDVVGAVADYRGMIDQVAVDRRIYEDSTEKAVLELSRYTDSLFSIMLGEEGESGARTFGTPKNSATEEGLLRNPSPVAATLGRQFSTPRTYIDRLLAKVNKAPFRADSYTSNPQYDSFVNNYVFPILEANAETLLNSDRFENASMRMRLEMVNSLLTDAKKRVKDAIEGNPARYSNEYLENERRKFMSRDRQIRIQAKEDLQISTPDDEMTLYQIQIVIERMKFLEQGL